MSGTLQATEFHPAAVIARDFIMGYLEKNSGHILLESLASNAISGNRMAEICFETLHRLIAKEPVSDRYLMGLAWMLWQMERE